MEAIEILLHYTAIYGLCTATTYFILEKYGITEIIPLKCIFCLCFWISMFFAIVGVLLGAELITLVVPFMVPPLARFLI